MAVAVDRSLAEAKDLGTWLYRYRMSMFMTQAQMAAEYGIGRSTLSEWERGTLPDVDHIVLLLAYHPEHADRLAMLWRQEHAARDGHPKEALGQSEAYHRFPQKEVI